MAKRVRARKFGINMGLLKPGKLNAITDVEGVGVGHSTLISGDNIRTGITAIVPHQGNPYEDKVTAAVDIFNAFGKAIGLNQIMFEGVIEVPILLTETLNVWRVANSVVDYMKEGYGTVPRSLNVVVGETNGSYLTDNFNRHLGKEHVFEAINNARSLDGQGPVTEGNVGAGTPMTGYGFKGGIGTASRKYANFTVGILVQLNCGSKDELRIDGVPIGREVEFPKPTKRSTGNSIMMICATDLDIESRQLWKVAKRVALGLARTGSYGGNGSGDFTIAFTTGKKTVDELQEMVSPRPVAQETMTAAVPISSADSFLSHVYRATVEATEEAIINALFKAETMQGRDGNIRHQLPYDQVAEIWERHGRALKK